MNKRGLGKGLSALIPSSMGDSLENGSETGEKKEEKLAKKIPMGKIVTNPYQPRKKMDQEKMKELVQSIKEHGLIQPVVVRKKGEKYELVAGERRFRAALASRLKEIPAIVLKVEDGQMLEIALIENLQREDLNCLEEAEAYKTLIEKFGLTQEKIAEKIGKSRPVIANTLRLLNLPEEIKEMLQEKVVSPGHARLLLSLEEKSVQLKLAGEVKDKKLSVRELENKIAQIEKMKKQVLDGSKNYRKAVVDPYIIEMQENLSQRLGTRVIFKPGKKRGRIEIEYYSSDELERIKEILLGGGP